MSAEIDGADDKNDQPQPSMTPANGTDAEAVIAAATPPAVLDARIDAAAVLPVAAPPDARGQVGEDTIFTGEVLKQIREQRRITLKEIADRTRISVSTLAALEAERFEDLPNARVYVRGFVRCLAEEIGLDKDHVSRTYVPRWEAWFAVRH